MQSMSRPACADRSRAGVARVDNLFMNTSRMFNAFERPVGSLKGHSTVWHGYSPYSPRMVEKSLTIFRTVADFHPAR